MKRFPVLLVALLGSPGLVAAQAERLVTAIKLPSGQTAVVAEGDLEARSTGSFSVRLYDAAAPGDETTFFTAGLVRGRDGTIEKVTLADVDGDQQPEIVVTVRSAGTGSYVSAHAFAYDERAVRFRAGIEGLPPDADPVAALRESLRIPE